MTRANARELAIHLIYSRDFTGEEPEQSVPAVPREPILTRWYPELPIGKMS